MHPTIRWGLVSIFGSNTFHTGFCINLQTLIDSGAFNNFIDFAIVHTCLAHSPSRHSGDSGNHEYQILCNNCKSLPSVISIFAKKARLTIKILTSLFGFFLSMSLCYCWWVGFRLIIHLSIETQKTLDVIFRSLKLFAESPLAAKNSLGSKKIHEPSHPIIMLIYYNLVPGSQSLGKCQHPVSSKELACLKKFLQ